jgi:Fic family protein
VWRGRRLRAFVPELLEKRDLELRTTTVARTAAAVAEVGHAAAELGSYDYEPLARMLLRAEGVASSFIEGVQAPLVDVVLAEQEPGANAGAAAWVAANLAAVSEAVTSEPGTGVTVDRLCRWHRVLMTGSPTPHRYVGRLRDQQGWIGGHDPTDAHLITPPPEYLPELVDDLIVYANRDDLDPVAQAAIAHAQFEVIHPFADGNGRIGRVLAAWVLARRLLLVVPPPLSVAIAGDVGGYTSGLTLFRLGDHNSWARWFADAIRGAGQAQSDLVAEVGALKQQWRERLSKRAGRALRSDAAAWQILDILSRHLVLTTPLVAGELGLTYKAAKAALDQLADANVLLEYGTTGNHRRGRPATLYVSSELLGLAGSNPLR